MANLSLITFGDLINLAFLTAGIVGQGQSVGAQDMTNATQMLNAMLGQWQRRRYLVYYLEETSISATGAQSYSVGPGCDFNIGSRPSEMSTTKIRSATPTCGAASPIPGAAYIVSIMSVMSRSISGVMSATGAAGACRTDAP